MKTIRFIGMALIIVLLSVGFTACRNNDEENNGGTMTSIEGTWYRKSEVWYAWKNGQPDMSIVTSQRSYEDYNKERIWVFRKNGDNWILEDKNNTYNLEKIGNNGRRGESPWISPHAT